MSQLAWPLLFTHHGTILGQGYLAEIELKGRLLATPELEGVWLDGVNPGAFAIGAPTLSEANKELRDTLTRLFIDFAEQSGTFEKFKSCVEQFFNDTDTETEREWNEAVSSVRAGNVSGLPEGLPRFKAESELVVRVTRKPIETVTPKDNGLIQQELQSALGAAA